MKLIILPLLVSVAYIGFEHRDAIVDQYRAAYPADPAKREALEQCARIDPNFNRLDTIDRDHCYAAIAPRVATGMVPGSPGSGVSYAYNPSHLPANDIRRQEANAGYGAARRAPGAAVGLTSVASRLAPKPNKTPSLVP